MDYIKEELRRQQRLWSGLMLGGQRRETAEETAAGEVRGTPADGGKDGAPSVRSPGEKNGPVRKQLALRSRRQRRAFSRAWGLEDGGAAAAAFEFTEGEEAGADRETAVPVRRKDAVETAEAQALSRVFQRDARRYDGAFSLY